MIIEIRRTYLLHLANWLLPRFVSAAGFGAGFGVIALLGYFVTRFAFGHWFWFGGG